MSQVTTEDFPLKYVLRNMAWQRARGELLSVLETYFQEMEQFEQVRNKIATFIQDIEDNW